MAQRGSKKELSVRHEERIASLFDGERSPSSGAAAGKPGDVTTRCLKIECKETQTQRLPVLIKELSKAAMEAWEHSLTPMLAKRYYAPRHPLANSDGWIDITIMLASDQAEREASHVLGLEMGDWIKNRDA